MILPTLRPMLLGALGAIIVIALWPTPKVTTRVTATTDPVAHVHGTDEDGR